LSIKVFDSQFLSKILIDLSEDAVANDLTIGDHDTAHTVSACPKNEYKQEYLIK
jgi:hypothetical protein